MFGQRWEQIAAVLQVLELNIMTEWNFVAPRGYRRIDELDSTAD